MNTFTVTYHHTNNYGAVLQAYALQQIIKKLGHENTIFEYPYNGGIYESIVSRSANQALRLLAKNCLTFLRRKEIRQRDNSFKAFRRDRMRLSQIYQNMQQLQEDPPDAEGLIVGSDQVWNLKTNPPFIPARFLDFGAESAIRISYAASIEHLNYTDEQKEMVKRQLQRFQGISLREESARRYIADIIGKDCVTHIDPVLLLPVADWIDIEIQPRFLKPYILCYQVLSNDNVQAVVNALKKRTGFPIVSVCPDSIKRIQADHTLFDVSPEEFIGLYHHAEIVVSTSFHGTAFAIVFNKPFYALTKSQGGNRIADLLDMLKLSSRLISDVKSIPPIETDYSEANQILDEQRGKAIEYLKEMLTLDHQR